MTALSQFMPLTRPMTCIQARPFASLAAANHGADLEHKGGENCGQIYPSFAGMIEFYCVSTVRIEIFSLTPGEKSDQHAQLARFEKSLTKGGIPHRHVLAVTLPAQPPVTRLPPAGVTSACCRLIELALDTPILVLSGRVDLPFYCEELSRASLGPLYARLGFTASEEAGRYAMLETPIPVASQIERQPKKFASRARRHPAAALFSAQHPRSRSAFG